MSNDRLHQLRMDHAADAYLGDEPPDLCPMRAMAEREELADAVSRLADGTAVRCPPIILWCPWPVTSPQRCTATWRALSDVLGLLHATLVSIDVAFTADRVAAFAANWPLQPEPQGRFGPSPTAAVRV